ncbi:MAG: ROK family protein [Desulfatiglandales bacterium]
MEEQCIGIDLGGTNIRIGLVNERDEVGDLLYLSVKEYSSWDDLLIKLISIIRKMEVDRIKAAGIAVAGGVSLPQGVVSYSPHMRWIDGQPIKESLARAINVPVLIDNDANAITYGEWMYGAGKGLSSIICLTLGSGVGAGIILKGNLYRGEDGLGGEIGHMCVQPNGRPCRCGKRGCLEAYSSGTAVSTIYRETNQNGQIDNRLNPVQIYERAVGGDKRALGVFNTLGVHLGIAIANLVNVLSTHHYIIAGGVSHAWELFFDPLEEALEANLFNPHKGRVKVFRGQLGDKAGVVGVARMARDYLKSKIQ